MASCFSKTPISNSFWFNCLEFRFYSWQIRFNVKVFYFSVRHNVDSIVSFNLKKNKALFSYYIKVLRTQRIRFSNLQQNGFQVKSFLLLCNFNDQRSVNTSNWFINHITIWNQKSYKALCMIVRMSLQQQLFVTALKIYLRLNLLGQRKTFV